MIEQEAADGADRADEGERHDDAVQAAEAS